jgi:hypothetical protein
MTASLNAKNLPADSHRAELSITSQVRSLRPGERKTIGVGVRNVSGIDWPAGCWLSAGNHWRSTDDGEVAIRDDGRTVVHEGLPAGQTINLRLEINAPDDPGNYELEVDLIEEKVTWFADRGSTPAGIDVVVRQPEGPIAQCLRALRRAKPAGDEPAPFSMNGLPRDRVESAVTGAGCLVADVVPNLSGGFHWDGYRYFVTKS